MSYIMMDEDGNVEFSDELPLSPIDKAMRLIDPMYRYVWCGGDPGAPGWEPLPCACCGCANHQVQQAGFSYVEWKAWVDAHQAPASDNYFAWNEMRDAWNYRHEIEARRHGQARKPRDPNRLPA